jgi:hypothetical protein
MGSALQVRLQGRLHLGLFICSAQFDNPLYRQMNKTPVAATILPKWAFPHATFDSRAFATPF